MSTLAFSGKNNGGVVFPDSESTAVHGEIHDSVEQAEDIDGLRFKVGDKVAGIYFVGTVIGLPQDGDDLRQYAIQIKDTDARVDGMGFGIMERELTTASIPHYQTEYLNYLNKSDSPDREPTFGECVVGLSVAKTGIDSNEDVYKIKKLCADLIDETQHQMRVREREIIIASQEPTNKISASVATKDLYRETQGKIVEIKFLLVSAAIGNNDRA